MQIPIWFGLIFVIVGLVIGLAIWHDPQAEQIKGFWIGLCAAASFPLFGVLFMWTAVRSRAANKIAEFAYEPAMRDFAWNKHMSIASRFQKLGPTLGFAIVTTVFLGLFAAQTFGLGGRTGEGLIIRIAMVGFLGIPAFLWLRAIGQTIEALRFGPSRVEFTQFPYRAGKPVTVRWIAPENVHRMTRGVFTLRCIEEYFEVTRRGRNQSRRIAHDEIWSSEWHFDHEHELATGEAVDLKFVLPDNAIPTSMHGDGPAVLWELDVKLSLPGPDFSATYLIPIY